ncbi:hypothetical protein C5613_33235 [Rhodococcus opacus]|uniref:Uncharacterized protein n=1 Tax=Rhodococcus opacus TaxID=37919 RepID=A0A2S8IT66_RHOOP|nr:hypothetical protein C5613_33235 [Rhodococcus opacus]
MSIANHALGEADLVIRRGIAHLLIVIDPTRTDYAPDGYSRRLRDRAVAHREQGGRVLALGTSPPPR